MYDFPGGSGGKVSAYNVGDIGSIPGWGRSHGEGNGHSFQYSCPPAKKKKKDGLKEILWGFPCSSGGKVSACNAGDLGLIPESGRSPGEGNGNPLQYSCLENPMDQGTWWATVHGVTKSQTQLSDFTYI